MSTVTRFPHVHRDEYQPAAIHPDVQAVRLARALAREGLALTNLSDGRLLIHPCPRYHSDSNPLPEFLRWLPGPEAA